MNHSCYAREEPMTKAKWRVIVTKHLEKKKIMIRSHMQPHVNAVRPWVWVSHTVPPSIPTWLRGLHHHMVPLDIIGGPPQVGPVVQPLDKIRNINITQQKECTLNNEINE
jgi:hypothetical protein